MLIVGACTETFHHNLLRLAAPHSKALRRTFFCAGTFHVGLTTLAAAAPLLCAVISRTLKYTDVCRAEMTGKLLSFLTHGGLEE